MKHIAIVLSAGKGKRMGSAIPKQYLTVGEKPIINYIFACDKTKNPTMKNIIRSIARGIGSIDIKNTIKLKVVYL